MVALPFALSAGVKLSLPLEATVGPALKSVGSVLSVIWKLRVWALSLAEPFERLVAHGWLYAPESSATVTLPPLVKDGVLLTATNAVLSFADGVAGSSVRAVASLGPLRSA